MSEQPPGLDTSQAPDLHGRNPTAEEYMKILDRLVADAEFCQLCDDGRETTVMQEFTPAARRLFRETIRVARELAHIVQLRRGQVERHEAWRRNALQRIAEAERAAQRARDALHGADQDEPIKAGGTD